VAQEVLYKKRFHSFTVGGQLKNEKRRAGVFPCGIGNLSIGCLLQVNCFPDQGSHFFRPRMLLIQFGKTNQFPKNVRSTDLMSLDIVFH